MSRRRACWRSREQAGSQGWLPVQSLAASPRHRQARRPTCHYRCGRGCTSGPGPAPAFLLPVLSLSSADLSLCCVLMWLNLAKAQNVAVASDALAAGACSASRSEWKCGDWTEGGNWVPCDSLGSSSRAGTGCPAAALVHSFQPGLLTSAALNSSVAGRLHMPLRAGLSQGVPGLPGRGGRPGFCTSSACTAQVAIVFSRTTSCAMRMACSRVPSRPIFSSVTT